MNACYWSKLLLFGEYSMIFDSQGLVIPMKKFSAKWKKGESEILRFSRGELRKFARFLSEDELLLDVIDTTAFRNDLEDGLALATNVPFGYGLGSSGTVVAAVYDRYAREKVQNPLELKKIFSRMEGYFHGSSSGIDPLQCYIGKPFRIGADGVQILPDDFLPENVYIGLLDTKVKSNTKPLVDGFKKQREDSAFLHDFEQNYLPCVNACMDTLICGETSAFFEAFRKLSHAQTHFFSKMIPESVRPLFEKSAEAPFAIKILGSGGGGYMLLMTDDAAEASKYLEGFEVMWV